MRVNKNNKGRRSGRAHRLTVWAFLVAWAQQIPVAAACGVQDVCTDVLASFYGQVTVGIVLTWDTDSEDSGVATYKLKRYDCTNPQTCTVDVTSIGAVGTCNDLEEYSYTDSPPSGNWTYTLEVWTSGNTRACSVDVVPE